MTESPSAAVNFEVTRIPYEQTGAFSDLILHYLNEENQIKPFYHRFPSLAHFAEQAREKKVHFKHRPALVEALRAQYASARIACKALDRLAEDNTFAVTTGHQVCLFTGPVYFIYKIASAIKTCRLVEAAHPDIKCVPIFWMATEDHDFDEANHFYVPGKRFVWESGQGGAVGRMDTVGMDELLQSLKQHFGVGYKAAELHNLFEQAYLKHKKIADATRYLVDQLFGSYGVVCVDGDDPALKKLVVSEFGEELLESKAAKAVQHTSAELSNHYSVQAHPRDINLFYLDEGLRERIVRNEDGTFTVLHTKLNFSEETILDTLRQHPERFSPNVILRPLYQECILPNLAYIGGGGELAYWLQLKGIFEAYQVPFPMLMLRNSALLIDADEQERFSQLGISPEDLFLSPLALEEHLLKKNTVSNLNLDHARDRLEVLYKDVEAQLLEVDASLRKSAKSAHVRSDHLLIALEKKLMRAERRKQKVLLGRLQRLRESLFPAGGLQERKWNFSHFYSAYGAAWIEALVDHFEPFSKGLTVLFEKR